MNMTTIEYSYRPSEDKVNRSFDIAILVILTAVLAIRIKGILICLLYTSDAADE